MKKTLDFFFVASTIMQSFLENGNELDGNE